MKMPGRRSVICKATHKQEPNHAAVAEFRVYTLILDAVLEKVFHGKMVIILGVFMTQKSFRILHKI
jgi:hypothetical protein